MTVPDIDAVLLGVLVIVLEDVAVLVPLLLLEPVIV